MGRRMKPISDRKPAKQLALKLRALKGDIPYARMAKQVHVKPNTLSTMADGTYRGWPCVEQFLRAVELCGGVVTEADRSQCRALHKIAKQLHRERGNPHTPTSGDVSAQLPKVETVVLAPRVAADDEQAVVTFTRTAPLLACPHSLAKAKTVHDIIAALLDLIADKRMDIRSWRQNSTSWHAERSGTPEWELLTGRTEPTLPVVLSIVGQCGGETADLARWEHQWNRIVLREPRYVGSAKAPEKSRASEADVAISDTDPVSDDDLLRIRDHLGTGAAGQSGQLPFWRRITARARSVRRLTKRSPGQTLHPPDE